MSAASTAEINTVYIFNNKLPIYIPRIDTRSLPRCPPGMNREELIKEFIADKFHERAIGKVSRVDLLEKTTPDGWNFYIAFCHFEEWYDTEDARELQGHIKDPDTKAKFYFHDKYFWIINENTKPINEEEAKLNRTIYEHERTIAMLREDIERLHMDIEYRDRVNAFLTQQVTMMAGGQVPIFPQQYIPTTPQVPAASSGRRHYRR